MYSLQGTRRHVVIVGTITVIVIVVMMVVIVVMIAMIVVRRMRLIVVMVGMVLRMQMVMVKMMVVVRLALGARAGRGRCNERRPLEAAAIDLGHVATSLDPLLVLLENVLERKQEKKRVETSVGPELEEMTRSDVSQFNK